jgi:hypothetical protein
MVLLWLAKWYLCKLFNLYIMKLLEVDDSFLISCNWVQLFRFFEGKRNVTYY